MSSLRAGAGDALAPQIARTVRVAVQQAPNPDGTQEETRTYEDVIVGPDGAMFLYSDRPPEEAFKFGVPLGPHESFMQVQRIRLTSPSERGITKDRDDGLCVYCQLLLLRDAPEYAAHQPCMALLIRNWDRCPLCTLINVSIGQANPDLKARFDAGMDVADLASADTRIWVRSEKFERYSLMWAWMGDQTSANLRGTPIVWTTRRGLGSLSHRMIWEPYSDSGQSDPSQRLTVIKEWLQECQSRHAACNLLSGQGTPLPTRVLKITPFTIHLHESNGERAPYIALSHCWGRTGPLKTLRSNLEQHKEGIDADALPLSYKDVVAKVWYLGFQYLWIDSLCIIQDDGDDWEAEAARMADVYSNATLTFAATEAADPSDGCLPMYNRAFQIPLPDGDHALLRFQDHLGLDGRDAPLNRRGWTLQEAALSPRMVCFDNNQLLWKCTTRHESEDGLWVAEGTKESRGWNLRACLEKLRGAEESYAFWYGMMEDYSRRELTFEKDRLPALAGMVEVFKKHVDDVPLLGLWRGDLANGLLWSACEPRETAPSGGGLPSWSWASARGAVSWDGSFVSVEDGEKLEVVSAEVSWVGRPMTSPLANAVLKVRGRMRKAKVVRNGNFVYLHELDEPTWSSGSTTTRDEQVEKPEVLGYCQMDLVGYERAYVWCLEVYHGLQRPGPEGPRNHAHKVLVLEPSDKDQGVFKRVGVGCVWKHSYREGEAVGPAVKETFLDSPRQTVTIV